MNPLPNSDLDQYVRTVLTLYLELPETPSRATPQNQMVARQLQQRGVPPLLFESALPGGVLAQAPEASKLCTLVAHSFLRLLPTRHRRTTPQIQFLAAMWNMVEYLRRKMKPFAGERTQWFGKSPPVSAIR